MAKTKEKEEIQDKEKEFQDKMKSMEKKFGKGSIIYGKDIDEELEVVQSGSLTLDIATGINGYPIGKLIELFGPESSGKSTLTLHAIVGFQKVGKCGLIDYEHSFDAHYAKCLGVDVDSLIISQPETMEDGYNIMEEFIKSGYFRLLIMDSHTAAIPKMRLDGAIGETKIAPEARVNSEGLKRIKPLLKPNRCTVIGISQLRTDIGGYGTPEKPTGGLGWRFYTDMRFKITKQVKKEEGYNKTVVEIVKSKVSKPFGKAEFPITWGIGVDRQQEIIDLAVEYKLLTKGGAWYTIGETKVCGDEKLKEFLNDNPEFASEIEIKVVDKIKNG